MVIDSVYGIIIDIMSRTFNTTGYRQPVEHYGKYKCNKCQGVWIGKAGKIFMHKELRQAERKRAHFALSTYEDLFDSKEFNN